MTVEERANIWYAIGNFSAAVALAVSADREEMAFLLAEFPRPPQLFAANNTPDQIRELLAMTVKHCAGILEDFERGKKEQP